MLQQQVGALAQRPAVSTSATQPPLIRRRGCACNATRRRSAAPGGAAGPPTPAAGAAKLPDVYVTELPQQLRDSLAATSTVTLSGDFDADAQAEGDDVPDVELLSADDDGTDPAAVLLQQEPQAVVVEDEQNPYTRDDALRWARWCMCKGRRRTGVCGEAAAHGGGGGEGEEGGESTAW